MFTLLSVSTNTLGHISIYAFSRFTEQKLILLLKVRFIINDVMLSSSGSSRAKNQCV